MARLYSIVIPTIIMKLLFFDKFTEEEKKRFVMYICTKKHNKKKLLSILTIINLKYCYFKAIQITFKHFTLESIINCVLINFNEWFMSYVIL